MRKQSSGAELPVAVESAGRAARQPVVIHLGLDAMPRPWDSASRSWTPTASSSAAWTRGTWSSPGRRPTARNSASANFLERFVGVRWLMPGPDGDDVPAPHPGNPAGRDSPAAGVFLAALQRPGRRPQTTWARRNRMHSRVQFHHNLIHLFPPEKYVKTASRILPHPRRQAFPARRQQRARLAALLDRHRHCR